MLPAASVIRLKLHSSTDGPAKTLEMTDLRVNGGVLWNALDHGLIASYSDGAWKHRGQRYSRIAVVGGCCLLFGTERDPSLISDPLEMFLFSGTTFQAAGITIAEYSEDQDSWRGIVRATSWSSMRLFQANSLSVLVDPARIDLLNPWESGATHHPAGSLIQA